MKIKVILEPSDEGGYTIYAPSLPGCISEGDSLDEALVNIQEAIELYLESDLEDIDPTEGMIMRELVV
jgi:predicted RNase H-like HicB family nuclease